MEPLEALQKLIGDYYRAGRHPNFLYDQVSRRVKRLELKIESGIQTFIDEVIARLKAQPVELVKEIPQQGRGVPVQPEEENREEEWVSTWDLHIGERLDAIADFLHENPDEWFMRSQIEVGAGYRHPDIRMESDLYKKMVRRLQRDLQLMMDDGDVVRTTKPNPKHKKGQNDDIVLYKVNTESPEPKT